MKIIVDEMPKNYKECALKGTVCLSRCDPDNCVFLKPITDFGAEEHISDDFYKMIPIRKAKGDEKETCTWKSPHFIGEEGNEVFEVECSSRPLKRKSIPNNFSFQDFKYCPFCGKEIDWQ